jgi:hypothetical protein
MERNRRISVTVAVLLSAIALLFATACSKPPVKAALPARIDIYYFYDELCASCDGTEEFRTIAEEALAGVREQYPYAIHTNNVFRKSGRELYERITGEMGLDRDMLELPLLIADGRVFQGNEGIARNLREAFLSAGERLFGNDH